MASLDEERQEFLSSDKAKNLSLLDFRPLNLGLLWLAPLISFSAKNEDEDFYSKLVYSKKTLIYISYYSTLKMWGEAKLNLAPTIIRLKLQISKSIANYQKQLSFYLLLDSDYKIWNEGSVKLHQYNTNL